jgi:hypothetical protein
MTLTKLYKVTDNQLIITLPVGFKDKQVLVTIDDRPSLNEDKISMMKLAAKDPLYLSDLQEVNDDFDGIEHDTL